MTGQKDTKAPETRFPFTRAKLSGLPLPGKGWIYCYDAVVRNLAIGVGATGVKSFRFCRKLSGSWKRITLGLFDSAIPETHELEDGAKPLDMLGARSLNVRMARKLAVAVGASLDVGRDPAEEKRAQRQRERNELTLGELFEHYLEDRITEGKKGGPLTWLFEKYVGAIPDGPQRKHGKKRTKEAGSVNWQARRLSTIQDGDVARLRSALAKNISPTTANRVMELLKAMFNFARKKKLYAGANPAADISDFKLQSRERRIERHEAQKFFETLNAEEDADFRDYVFLSICTGARRANVLQMRWDELSLQGAAWRVTGERMKNGDTLVIPLIPRAVAILQRRAENANGHPWVFAGKTPAGHAGPFKKQWARFIKSAEVPGLRVHDLRRTLGSWMSSSGASTVVTMRALGHKTIDAALVYQRLELAPVLDAMQNGVAGLLKAAEPEPPKPKSAKVLIPRKAFKGFQVYPAKGGR